MISLDDTSKASRVCYIIDMERAFGPILEIKYFKSIPPNPQAIKLDLLQYLTIISKVMPLM